MANNIVKIYGDGEFWLNGQRKAKIYPDGEIWANNKMVGKLYPDGDIYIDGKKVGRVYSDGDLYIDGKKAASGIYLLDLLDGDGKAPVVKNNEVRNKSYNIAKSGGSSIGNSLSDIGDVGCGGIFVAVLIIIAFIYACFAIWFTEMPQILFGNFYNVGKIAMVSVYVCMFYMIYAHCKTAIKNGRVMFGRGLLMQGGTFLANIVVYTVIDMIITASQYGFSIWDAFGELWGVLGGSVVGIAFAAFAVALAPTTVSSIISAICIKKGVKVTSSPTKKTTSAIKKSATASKANVTAKPASQPGIRPGRAPAKAKTNTSKGGLGIVLVVICVGLTLVATYIMAWAPFTAIAGMWVKDFLPLGKVIWLPLIAVVLGVILRRKWHQKSWPGFCGHWFLQSVLFMIANCVNILTQGFGDDAGAYLIVCGLFSFGIGLFVTLFTQIFVTD